MDRKRLAEQLLSANASRDRLKLLRDHPELADAGLALVIRDLCYQAWTSNPVVAQKAARTLASLKRVDGSEETAANAAWVSGIASLTRGKLERALSELDTASTLFRKMGRRQDSAQPKVAQLIALGMLGRYDDALKVGLAALKIFEEYGDELAAGKIEINLSNIVSRRERHRDAIRYGASAVERFERLGEKGWLAMAQNGLARSHAQISEFAEAERIFALALQTARSAGLTLVEADIEASMSNLALFRGQFAEALRSMELARRKYADLEMHHERTVAELEIADIYSQIDLKSDALRMYVEAIRSLQKLKLRREEAWARRSLGSIAVELGKPGLAEREFRKARRLFASHKNHVAEALVGVEEAALQLERGNFDQAAEILNASLAAFTGPDNERSRVMAEWLKSEAFRRGGDLFSARKILRKLERDRIAVISPELAQAIHTSLGKVSLAHGKHEDAARHFESAVQVIESSRLEFSSDEFSRGYVGKRLEPFDHLSQMYASRGEALRAFEYVERSRSATLRDALGRKGQSQAVDRSDPLDQKADALRRELNWLYKRPPGAGEDQARHRILRTEEELTKITRQINAANSDREAGPTQTRVSPADIQRQLGSRNAIVEYVLFDGTYSAFVVTDEGVSYHHGLATVEDVRRELAALQFQFDGLRYGSHLPEAVKKQINSRAASRLRRLHDQLLHPLAGDLSDRDLIIAPAGSLNYVPFHALHDGESYVIEQRTVRYAPSASVWYLLSRMPPKPLANVLLMAYADEAIPAVEGEIRQLCSILPEARSLVGEEATFDAYLKEAPGKDILHIACHGQFRPEDPMYSSLHLSDGWVTVNDICAQHLDAGLVTLSACETGVNEVEPGEEILGLARGFLTAGARALIVSLWKVDDASTSEFMALFYENLQREGDIPASLRDAQIELLSRGTAPFYCAPFILIGA